ncbi:MAG: GntR family transcriptional regulator [Chitinophagaceae bacterium]|nr:GntR family transcriptional regulator [Chitinophagaceae bacterium]
MQPIFEIDVNRRTPKYLQIAHSITKAIKQGKFKRGDRILSINELSNEYMLSRDTVQKAYDMLEKEKILQAVRGKGFFINRTDIVMPYRILLVFNKLSNYKKMIYDSFVASLGNKATVDLKIHHSSVKLLKEITEASAGEYDYYVIMPHFYEQQEEAIKILSGIPSEKLLLLDKIIPDRFVGSPAVYQDFEKDIIDALETGLKTIRKYQSLFFVHPRLVPFPFEIVNGFRQFCRQYSFEQKVLGEIGLDHDVQKGQVYIVIEESDLVNLIKIIQRKKFIIGKDVGIISYNETPLKEILLGGIATISTDHTLMGVTAAEMIINQKSERIKNPFTLIPRPSL